jgi:hypothetical protein
MVITAFWQCKANDVPSCHFLCQWQWLRLDTNPEPWVDEWILLPLRYGQWTELGAIKFGLIASTVAGKNWQCPTWSNFQVGRIHWT